MPLRQLALAEFKKTGQGVARPEGVIGFPDNRIIASHHHAAIATFTPTTPPSFLGQKSGAPNGIAIDAQNRVIIANFGIYDQRPGPLERFDPATLTREILVDRIAGRTLTSCNFPVLDNAGNIFCSHSTFAPTWPDALDRRHDGFIFVYDPTAQPRFWPKTSASPTASPSTPPKPTSTSPKPATRTSCASPSSPAPNSGPRSATAQNSGWSWA